MKKNIVIAFLSVLLIFFLINSFISRQETEKFRSILDTQMKEIAGMQMEMSTEYYENFKKLKESNCSSNTLDSIWANSEYLKLYEKAMDKVENTKIE